MLFDTPVLNAPPFPPYQYQVIYADPPWQFDDKSLNRGGAERHYLTMTDDEILALPVSQIACDNSLLFMWISWAKLPLAIAVISAWGFEYKTCAFNWIKYHEKSGSEFMGMGSYTRANSEVCLLGKRGKGLKRIDCGVRQIVNAPIGRHSAKPAEVRERIVQLVGDVSRIELFARDQVNGWDNWGNEL
ncbi:MAG: transcriptional activator [Caudoviricetes sp.]|nr:MAG: transcriptional activator [Caudoviricetes sp.]